MILRRFLPVVGLIVLLQACTNRVYTQQSSAFIVLKTPTLKYADLGFVYENNDTLKVELYNAGQAMMYLEIDAEKVCMGTFSCMDKKAFNSKVLSAYYPDNILNNIFRGQVIFEGLERKNVGSGFIQKIIKDKKYNIMYKVLAKSIYFYDIINCILIKVNYRGRE